MASPNIQGRNWYKEVKSPKDSVPYNERLDFYLKRAAIKTNLKKLAGDFDATVSEEIKTGKFKSFEDLAKLAKFEKKVKSGDTIYKILLEYFSKVCGAEQAIKETYLSLAYLMKTNAGANVDKLFIGGKVVIEGGKLSVYNENGVASIKDGALRPMTTVEVTVEPEKMPAPSQTEKPADKIVSEPADEVDVEPEIIAEPMPDKKIEKLEEEFKILEEKDLSQAPAQKEVAAMVAETKVYLESVKEDEKKIETFEAVVKPTIEEIEPKVESNPTLRNEVREVLKMEPLPVVLPEKPLSINKFNYGNSDYEVQVLSTKDQTVKLDKENGERFFYHWISHYISKNALVNVEDEKAKETIIDILIGECRKLNPGVDLDKPSAFDGKVLKIPLTVKVDVKKKLEALPPDSAIKGEILNEGISKLAVLGKTEKYYVLNLPKSGKLSGDFDWKKIEAFNKKNNITIKAGEPLRIPVEALKTDLKYQGEVSFLQISVKDSSKSELVLKAVCKDYENSKMLLDVFNESHFYKKVKPDGSFAIPVAILKPDWQTYLLEKYRATPAKFRENSLYQMGEYDKFIAHCVDVEGHKYIERDEMIKAGLVKKVSPESRHFAFQDKTPDREKYLKEYASSGLYEIAEDFYKQTGYQLVVTSLFRTKAEQKDLAESNSMAAKGLSTHNFANSFDISNGRFIDPSGNEVTWSGTSGDAQKKLTGFRPVIEGILLKKQKEGKLMAMAETYAWHVMIASPGVGDGTKIPKTERPVSSEVVTVTPDLSKKIDSIDFKKIEGFGEFSRKTIQTMRDRKAGGKTMKLSELQTILQTDLIAKIRKGGQNDLANVLAGRTFEMAHMINMLASMDKDKNVRSSLLIYDERPEVQAETMAYNDLALSYKYFKEGRISKSQKLELIDSKGRPVGDYNMHKFLTGSNVSDFIDPNILMAKIGQETSFKIVKNLSGEVSAYTGQTVFGYFQLTSKQGTATEKRAKEIFAQLHGIPGEKFDFEELCVPYENGKYYVNPRAEVAMAIAIYENNSKIMKAANGGVEHPDQDLLAILAYNHGPLYIQDLLKYGVTVSKYTVPGGHKLSYVDSNGIVHTKVVSWAVKATVRKLLNKRDKEAMDSLKKELKKLGVNSFSAGSSVGLRVSEIEKMASLARGGKGQLYVSQVLSRSVMLKYIDKNNFQDIDDNAIRDAMILLSSRRPVTESNAGDILPADRR